MLCVAVVIVDESNTYRRLFSRHMAGTTNSAGTLCSTEADASSLASLGHFGVLSLLIRREKVGQTRGTDMDH